MDSRIHCFVSRHGGLLPRWRQAFPAAMALRPGEKVSRGGTPALIWIHLPSDGAPAEAVRLAREAFGQTPIVALSDQPGDDEALASFAAGARGYCNSHAVADLLERVADIVTGGGLWIGESLMQRLLQGTARMPLPVPADAPPDWAALLTERERQVALVVAEGSSNKEIARQLGITERTVKAHAGAIFEKLGVRDRLQLSLIVHGRKVN